MVGKRYGSLENLQLSASFILETADPSDELEEEEHVKMKRREKVSGKYRLRST